MMDIYYEVIGDGYPIILLHGNGEDHHIFDETVDVFKKDYQCILIDSRYHGRSAHQGTLTYQQMCDDVKNVVNELNLEKYDVIGFSDGGIVGLMLGEQDERLKHLVTIGANTKPQMIKLIYRLSMYIGLICLLPFCLYNPKARLSFKLSRLMIKEPQIEYRDLENIKITVLVMAGEMDMIKEEDTKMIADSLPYSVLKIIRHGNHFLLRDSFDQTIHEISLFLSTCHREEE